MSSRTKNLGVFRHIKLLVSLRTPETRLTTLEVQPQQQETRSPLHGTEHLFGGGESESASRTFASQRTLKHGPRQNRLFTRRELIGHYSVISTRNRPRKGLDHAQIARRAVTHRRKLDRPWIAQNRPKKGVVASILTFYHTP